MSRKRHLILGGGSAGLAALEQIRRQTQEDEVKVVTMEPYPPYSPTSLPYLLAGRINETDLSIHDEEDLCRGNSMLVTGKEVVHVAPEKAQVVYRDGTVDDYDTLLIATGSEPALPSIKGLDQVGCLGFHTLTDYRRLVSDLKDNPDVVVLGAGLVGMELASGLLERGCSVRIVEKEPGVLPLYFDGPAENHIREVFLQKGAHIFTGKEVSQVKRDKGRIEAIFTDGRSLDGDVLITATGVKARVSFLKDSGVRINQGILVDKQMRTNMPNIYAAGDVAEAEDFFAGAPGLNPILPAAVEQGKVAGANMAGQPNDYEGWISMNTFNFFGHRAFSAGLSMSRDGDYDILEENDGAKKQFKRLVFHKDRLVGAVLVNVEVDSGVLVYLIRKRAEIDAYKELLFERPRDVSRWMMLELEKKEADRPVT
jgi:phenylglyoxylate dehydrogenase epsilon subunit